jgi:MFS family permease
VWGYLKLEERGVRQKAPIDWAGNVTFALGLILVMVGITYGIQPYGGHVMGWTNPKVLTEIITGLAFLVLFAVIELRVANPMFRVQLFKIRAFAFGTLSSFLAALARGGLLFMLIIWLQGIWLPAHGVDFASTPLWAGICMLPFSAGILVVGPISGVLSDRYGARPFATGGMLMAALSFVVLDNLPTQFSYPVFGAVIFLSGAAFGAFASPNRAGVMNSLPPQYRGAGGGMYTTAQNSAQVLSIGIFFTLMILGLAAALPPALRSGLQAHGVSAATAGHVAHLPPISVLFAAFLGYNPIGHLVGAHTLSTLPSSVAAHLTSRAYFPSLISQPFRAGLHEAFAFAAAACVVAAVASLSRGGRYVHEETEAPRPSHESAPLEGRPTVASG